MWWCRQFLLLGIVMLAGCGFQPLHAPVDGAMPALAGVQVKPIPDRLGQQLRQALEHRLYRGQTPARQYSHHLEVSYSEEITFSAIDADASARYATITLEVLYTLTDAQDNSLLRDIIVVNQGYSIVFSEYATRKAQDDARQKALQNVADTIAYQVALAVQTRP